MNRAAFAEGSNFGTGWGIIGKTATKFTLVMRERAVWLIFDNEMLKESR